MPLPRKGGMLYLAPFNSLRGVQLNCTGISDPKLISIEMCVDEMKSEAGQCWFMGVL